MSQEQLGLQAGLEVESASARMNRYERGTRMPSVDLMVRIGEVLNLPLSYFYATDDNEVAILVSYHRMPTDEKKLLLEVTEQITSGNFHRPD